MNTTLENAIRVNLAPLVSSDPRVKIGRCTYGSPRLLLWAEKESIEIGGFCSLAEDVTIFGGGEHRSDWVTTYPLRIAFGDSLAGADGLPATKGSTRIGHDVWIGYRAIVLSGVSIGAGAIIGAGAVVARDVAPYSIVVGNPATVVKQRFRPDQVDRLLDIRWWDWPLEKIKSATPFLCSADVDRFIAYADTS